PRAAVADRQQRVAARRLRVGEAARGQVQVVVRLRLVDVAGAAARDRLELDELQPDARRERLRRRVELPRRQRGEATLVVSDPLRSGAGKAGTSASCRLRRAYAGIHVVSSSSPGRYGRANEPGPYGSR